MKPNKIKSFVQTLRRKMKSREYEIKKSYYYFIKKDYFFMST